MDKELLRLLLLLAIVIVASVEPGLVLYSRCCFGLGIAMDMRVVGGDDKEFDDNDCACPAFPVSMLLRSMDRREPDEFDVRGEGSSDCKLSVSFGGLLVGFKVLLNSFLAEFKRDARRPCLGTGSRSELSCFGLVIKISSEM